MFPAGLVCSGRVPPAVVQGRGDGASLLGLKNMELNRFPDENPHFLPRGDEIPEGGYEIPPSITKFLDVGNKFWGDCFLFPCRYLGKS
jgi:hypothetical protein